GAQNTHGVRRIHTPPTDFLRAQLEAVSDDVTIDAVKIGMLGNAATITEVRRWLQAVRPPVVVLDPVMVATSGHRLLRQRAEDAVREPLNQADMVTPTRSELALLVDEPVAARREGALAQGQRLMARHHTGVIVKGGHLAGQSCPDALLLPGADPVELATPRIETRNTHGTGCSLSSGL